MTNYYRSILKQAWLITWHNKWLWFFGLFAAFLGSGGEYNLLIKNVAKVQEGGAVITNLQTFLTTQGIGAWLATFSEVMSNYNAASIILTVLTVGLILVLIWLAFVSQAGLISTTFRLSKKEYANMHEGLKRGKKKFIPVFLLNILGKVFVYALLILLSLPFFFLLVNTQNLLWEWILIVVSFLVFIPIAIIVSFLVRYAVIFIVVKNSDIKASIVDSWKLFAKNWMVSLETALILFVINILVGTALIIALLFVSVPFVLLGFMSVYFDIASLYLVAWVLGGITAAFVTFTTGAMLATYQMTVWVMLFTKLTEGIVIPKILRLAATLPQKFKR